MSADQLLADLKAAGLTVVEEPKWKTRGNRWATRGKPEGVQQHHTAPPNPFPIKKLYGPPLYRTKANVATHEDGTLYLIAYKACNYSSGRGMNDVLVNNVRKGIAPRHNATKRGLKGGNRVFWNYENSHPGDGSAIPEIQLRTIVVSNIVVNYHFGLIPEKIISHAEWTSRKIDPNWNGSNRIAINQIRTLVKEGVDVSIGPNGEPNWDAVSDWAKKSWTWAWTRDKKILSDSSHPKDDIDKEQLMVHLKRFSGE